MSNPQASGDVQDENQFPNRTEFKLAIEGRITNTGEMSLPEHQPLKEAPDKPTLDRHLSIPIQDKGLAPFGKTEHPVMKPPPPPKKEWWAALWFISGNSGIWVWDDDWIKVLKTFAALQGGNWWISVLALTFRDFVQTSSSRGSLYV